MKVLNDATLKQLEHDRILYEVDQTHLLSIELVSEHIARVSIKKNKQWRLSQTWSIAPGLSDVPFQGFSRDLLAFPGAKDLSLFKVEENLFSLGPYIKVKIDSSPLRLSWFYKNDLLFQDRPTGAYYLSEKSHAHKHYTAREKDFHFYGLGEKAGPLNKAFKSFEMRNIDAMGYDAETSDPLYKHLPYYQVKSGQSYYGLYYDNFSTCHFNFGKELDNYHGLFSSYKAEDGDLDFYVFLNESSLEMTKHFSWLTGKSCFGPKWSLSYSGSTMQYTDADNAEEKMQFFLNSLREHQIPCHSFQLSSGYTSIGPKRYVFHWNRDKFPNPKEFVDSYKEAGVQVCANVKPVLLTDHPQYKKALKDNLFIEDESFGVPEESYFWDGYGSHLNFLNPKTRKWWKKNLQEQLFSYGITSIWNDNNEYQVWGENAVARTEEQSFIPISLIRPVQTLLMMKTSFEAQTEELQPLRPWTISRSGMPGMQRYAQTWSGDNRTEWKTILYNMKMSLSMSLSGIYNTGHDIGGFSGEKPNAELLLRWIQHGVFYPRFTIHSWNDDGSVTEPWSYPEVLDLVREALALRAKLSPYLYTLFYEAHSFYSPILRPSFWQAPDDPLTYNEPESFYLGENLLISTVIKEGETLHKTYLPKNKYGWFDFKTQKYFQGGKEIEKEVTLSSIPFYVEAGAIIPMTKEIEKTYQSLEKQRSLHLFPAPHHFQKTSTLFEDDGKSNNYQSGDYKYFSFDFKGDEQALYLDIKAQGNFCPLYTHFDIVLPEKENRPLYINGELSKEPRVKR